MPSHIARGLALLLFAPGAFASSPAAWSDHHRAVVTDCLASSGLRQARPEGDLMLFSDGIGTALLVRGFAAHSRKSTLALCIRRRGSGQVEVQRVYDGVAIEPDMLPAGPSSR